jgi:hypothetical protein
MDIHMTRAKFTTRVMVRLPFLFIVLFSAVILLIQSPAYADPDLRGLLIPPPDCAAPCFIGIRPGLTSVNAAVQQLQGNSLIQSIQVNSFDRYLEKSIQAAITLPQERLQLLLDAQNGIVEGVTLSGIKLRLGDVVLMLGQPEKVVLNDTLHRGFITYIAFYPQYEMIVVADLPTCSVTYSTFWEMQRSVSVVIAAAQKYGAQTDYYLTGTHESGESWAKLIQEVKLASCK